ncbi:MAG: AcrB/AcrD/AcrF family protein, partial [Rhodobacterales bacterium]|nr:AcrB/AcrD/AcrF family protein [Rhodobacterales bacterium]
EWGGSPGVRGNLPEGVSLTVLDNQAAFIEAAVSNLRDTALLGGFFAVGVLFLFLRDFRATAIVGAAIPMSIIIGFAPLYLNGITLNLMSLGGLALGVGMLVDNGVVVLESIQRWREQGLGRTDAAVRGTADVSAAVIASTMTTVAVFLPISFVEGVAGELFGDLSVAVVSSLMASLLVALFAVPTLAAFDLNIGANLSENPAMKHLMDSDGLSWGAWLKALVMEPMRGVLVGPKAEFSGFWTWRKERLWRWILVPYAIMRFLAHLAFRMSGMVTSISIALCTRFFMRSLRFGATPFAGVALWAAGRFQGVYGLFERRYTVALGALLTKPGSVLGLASLLLFVSVGLVDRLGTELIPELHQGRFTAELHLPVGTPLERTSVVVSEAEAIVKDHPAVSVVYSTVGVDRRADSRSDEGEHTARLRVQLTPGGDLAAREARVMENLRDRLSELPRMKVKMVRPALFSFRTPVEVVLYGWELDELRGVGDQVAERLSRVDGLRDVRSSLVSGNPEVRINYDRARLHRLGLDAATVAAKVRDKIQGVDATEIHQGEHRIALKVQLMENDRGTLADLRKINVNPNLTPVIPLDSVADFEEAMGPSEIRRVDQQRAVVVSANLEGFDLGSAGTDIGTALVDLDLPDTIRWSIAGQFKEMAESLGSLQFALGLAIFLVYVIMASTFENIIHPLVILFSVPLALVGAVGGLALSGSPISVVVFIGL